MAQKLVIKNFGPIKDAIIEVTDFMVFTGAQSSGKSTIAKLIYFFRSITYAIPISIEMIGKNNQNEIFAEMIGINFEMFFDFVYLKEDTEIEYFYDSERYIRLTYENASLGIEFNYPNKIDMPRVVYIPASRSSTEQLFSFYSLMDDGQKNALGFLVKEYINNTFKMRPEFKNGFNGLKSFNFELWQKQENLLNTAVVFIKNFMQGEYFYSNGFDTLLLPNGVRLSMSDTSSGQQESLWLLNLLLYNMLKGNNKFFIIEEPESNLFPEWQREIVKFISLVHNAGNQVLITTHNPYILAAINNIRYATILRENNKNVDSIIAPEYAINNLSAYYIGDGVAKSIIDQETQLIDNEHMDAISIPLNDDLDTLIDIDMGVDNATN